MEQYTLLLVGRNIRGRTAPRAFERAGNPCVHPVSVPSYSFAAAAAAAAVAVGIDGGPVAVWQTCAASDLPCLGPKRQERCEGEGRPCMHEERTGRLCHLD